MTTIARNHPAAAIAFLKHLSVLHIRYAVLHGLREIRVGSLGDIDLVIHHHDLERCIDSLRAWDGFVLVQILRYEATGFGLVLARSHGSCELLVVDLALDYRCSGRIFMTGPELLADRVAIDGIWHVSPEIELKCLLLKKFCEKQVVPFTQRQRIEALTKDLGEAGAAVYRDLTGPQLGAETHRRVAAGDWAEVISHTQKVATVMRRRAAARDPSSIIRYWTAELGRRIDRFRHPTGLLVTLLGPDGAGKSTIAGQLSATMLGPFRRAACFHFRPRLICGGSSERKAASAPDTRSAAASMAKIFVYLLDFWIGYVFVIRPALSRSTLVLFDRYVHDLLIDPKRYAYGGPKWLLVLARRLVPRPALVLILVADPSDLRRRKGEITEEDADEKTARYNELASQLEAAIIRSDIGMDETLSQAQAAVLAVMSRRHSRTRRPDRASAWRHAARHRFSIR